MRKSLLAGVFAAVGLVGLTTIPTSVAHAAACSTSDISMYINLQSIPVAACANNVTQGSISDEQTSVDSAFNTSAVLLVKDNADGSSTLNIYEGIRFTLSANNGFSNTGSYTLFWTDTNGTQPLNLPVTMNLVLGLYGGNNGDAYYLPSVTLPAFYPEAAGSFDIEFLNNGGRFPDLSHMDVFGVLASQDNPGGGDPTPAPEPMTLALMGSGLIGLGFAQRKRARRGQIGPAV